MDIAPNAFQVLGATPRDRKSRLIELAEDASLHGDAAVSYTHLTLPTKA